MLIALIATIGTNFPGKTGIKNLLTIAQAHILKIIFPFKPFLPW